MNCVSTVAGIVELLEGGGGVIYLYLYYCVFNYISSISMFLQINRKQSNSSKLKFSHIVQNTVICMYII